MIETKNIEVRFLRRTIVPPYYNEGEVAAFDEETANRRDRLFLISFVFWAATKARCEIGSISSRIWACKQLAFCEAGT